MSRSAVAQSQEFHFSAWSSDPFFKLNGGPTLSSSPFFVILIRVLHRYVVDWASGVSRSLWDLQLAEKCVLRHNDR